MRYPRPLRRYQQQAVEAFRQAREAGREQAYLVLPPGAGKTALGLEIARQLGRRTLVLCPNTAVQAQWLREWQAFRPATSEPGGSGLLVPAGASATLDTPVTALTYQALCTFDATSATLVRQIEAERGEEDASPALPAAPAVNGYMEVHGLPTPEARRALAAERRRARTLLSRGGTREQMLSLLHANGRALVQRMKALGPWTLVLDECHHLLEMWGYVTRALIQEVRDGSGAFVVGLTATPPDALSAREMALYRELFGAADLVVPTPAAVKEGELAPYQELVYVTTPAEHEARYIAGQHERFQALTLHLMRPDLGSLSFVEWLRQRVGERRLARSGGSGTSQAPGPSLSWQQFERAMPALANAALRLYAHYHLPLPDGAHLRERHRQPPTAADWTTLIEDYCLGHLRDSVDPRDVAVWEEIRRALPPLGYVLTRQGIRAATSPVDRVLALSASKGTAALDILAAERGTLGERLRALVLCDYEVAGRDALARLRGVLDPQAGSAALWLSILLSDPASAALEPVLVTGRTVACGRRTAVDLCAWLVGQAPHLAGSMSTESLFAQPGPRRRTWEDVVVVRPSDAWWRPRHYVPLITRYFEAGRTRCLVGTRGLLGEGWDARAVNALIDLTGAGTATAVHQMRGRSIRLDPHAPRKVANNWDVVCVAPDHADGAADYARFVRKHRRYFALTANGEIESGVSHIDVRLSPFGPPPRETFGEINRTMLERAQAREYAYDRWQVGVPYRSVEVETLRIRFERPIGVPQRRLLRHMLVASGRSSRGSPLATLHALAAALGIRAAPPLGTGDTLEDLAMAVFEALQACGGITTRLEPDSIRVTPQPDGYYRCYLEGARVEESRLFAESLDELLAPLASPRYIVARTVAPPPASTRALLWLLLKTQLGRPASRQVTYHAVPAYLAANRQRVAAFRRAWNRHVDRGAPLYFQDPRAQAILQLQQGEDPFRFTSQQRTLWE